MTEPNELTEYLAELRCSLKGWRKRRREIIEELRGNLLEEIEDAPASAHCVDRALDRFGPPQLIAGAFNDLLREKRIRAARLALAFATLSTAGGLAIERALTPAASEISPFPDLVQPNVAVIPGVTNISGMDPKTGKIVYYLKSR